MSSAMSQPALFLVRHARAGGPRAGERDFDRTLDDMGRADAARMAATLQKRGWTLGDIACSSARRCRQTADILLGTTPSASISFEEPLYDGALDAYLAVIGDIRSRAGDGAPVTIIGHNPILEHLAWECLGSATATRALPAGFLPGMVIAIARKPDTAPDELPGRLVEVLNP
ncbi:histidine phosphatase family protein [Rhizobium sp. DKSPLA3]|uniref:Histidine phosphatase family protein n=1 Tax=Rhizobium quercicola TaxID=2901226 RepID=A0A9X1NRT7_9HYPH|nr:histidine phosphatase family protein [Rhizobium quercicola]MCD7109845.1 histidine phosphatase family protein [Rhizobium quercicola]